MYQWRLITVGVVCLGAVGAMLAGYLREAATAERQVATLLRSSMPTAADVFDFNDIEGLPPPVARYFKHVLADGQPLVKTVTLQQAGALRTNTQTETWAAFTARHLSIPAAVGFVWNAKVAMPLATHVRVLDSYITGIGAGRVSLVSAIPVAAEADTPELNSGALHRYLAEAVWYPTALLPQSGVVWTPLNDGAALATLTDRGVTVSLEFRFNGAGEVTGVFTPARFGRFDGEYRQVPWEGHFGDYQLRDGMRVPAYGEVGWYANGVLELVWKGSIISAEYQFLP